jgi:sulfate transport system ATP-binding protein
MSISVRGLSKRFDAFPAVDAVDLDLSTGELVALLGPSGCGKTTLLRLIAGLETPDAGTIEFAGEDVTHLPARERGVGFVFQHYALFRHMSVFENVAFGQRVRRRAQRPSADELKARVARVLGLVQLDGLERRYPDQLSGGQRQRVALARALMVEPRVLLLDEPFGALDAQVRRELRRWLRRLHDRLHITSVFVTHDQEEALDVADRIVVLRAGRIEQAGSAEQLDSAPASGFVHQFLGESNRLPAQLRDGKVWVGNVAWRPTGGATLADGPVDACVRPHDFHVLAAGDGDGGLPVEVRDSRRWGGRLRLDVVPAFDSGLRLALETDARQLDAAAAAPGARLWIRPERLFVFARSQIL